MIFLKNAQEINIIRQSARILSQVFGIMAQEIRPGVTTKRLDSLAEAFIQDHGGRPSFKGFKRFPASVCTSVNDAVVHGIPNDYRLVEGDIVSIDCGVAYKGFHSDAAFTFPVGRVSTVVEKLLATTQAALYEGIRQASAGKRTGDIGQAIQDYVHTQGCSVVRELAGHGIGRKLHEDPDVPNYGKRGRGVKLRPGMVLAIEPMINLGKSGVVYERDGWTVSTRDKTFSAHFEHTVVVHAHTTEVLTTYEHIEKALQAS
ncbi:MAG: type I methionyl aminopeptidase [Bacteroidota bacterium]